MEVTKEIIKNVLDNNPNISLQDFWYYINCDNNLPQRSNDVDKFMKNYIGHYFIIRKHKADEFYLLKFDMNSVYGDGYNIKECTYINIYDNYICISRTSHFISCSFFEPLLHNTENNFIKEITEQEYNDFCKTYMNEYFNTFINKFNYD